MKTNFKNFSISLISIFFLILFVGYSINLILKKPLEIINFSNSDINQDFEIEIASNLNDIDNYLKEYLFIESHLFQREDNEINIKINLKKPFAINNLTNEVIFYDNTKASIRYFRKSYLEKIKLKDISKDSIYINYYLIENYQTLSSLFNIDQIEYIDGRRYNLVLSDGRIVMLPKVIDSRLLYFIKNNIDLINKSTNYEHFLDLRNFHHKTIRLK